MRTITLEEHFASPAFLEGPGKGIKEQANDPEHPMARIFGQLTDLGSQRIAVMDAAGIDVQVLSLNSPGVEQLESAEAVAVARETNDFLAEAVKHHPSRFAGFATLPTAAPDRAAKELERTIHDYAFRGAAINGHVRGRYLDDKFFWPILESAEALNIPIYLHPTLPPQPVMDASYKGFDPMVTSMFAAAGWGWHIETAIHVNRLILGGAFDRYPKLQIVIGHMGETLPFMVQRLDRILSPARTRLERPVSAYLRENVHYTFSGFNFTPVFLVLLLQVGVGRIMFSTDHPYASMAEGRAFLDQLPVSDPDRECIAHGNAERLFGF
jgi:uncharacterized protein